MAKEEQIKSQIILEGEKEYRAACKGINTSLREIGSEMKLATAEFGDNAESIEALTRKQDILQKQLDEQAKKAKAAEAALKKMREGGIDPTDPAYQKMQTNLNNTRAEMVKVQRELDDTSKKLKSSKIDWESVGDTVGKVGKAIGAGVAAMGAAIGAAATALFAKAGDAYTTAASIFAFGAWFAVVSMGASYVAQLLIAETWRQDPDNMQIYFWGKRRHCTQAHAERARYAACGFWIAAMVLAFVGVWVALSSQG